MLVTLVISMVTFLRLLRFAAKASADSLMLMLLKGCDRAQEVQSLNGRSV